MMNSDLIKDISEVFAGAPQPTDDELLHPACMDDVDVLEFYGGVCWQDMTDADVAYSYAALTAFNAKAFRYYLPAFLIWTLRNADSPEYAGESILRALDPGTDQEMLHDFRKSKFAEFTSDEVAQIKRFLNIVSSHPYLGEFADAALINYWLDA